MLAQSLCLIVAVALCGFADEPKSAALIQTLPLDGTWATFNVVIKVEGKETLPTWTIRSVGQAFHSGKQCRLIEMEQASETPEFPNLTWRLVVPEDEFGEGKHPLGKATKIWRKLDKQDPESVESLEITDIFFATFLKGPLTNVKLEAAKEKVSWQQGDLECAVVSGDNEIQLGTAKITWKHRVFRHDKVPFGLAGLNVDLQAVANGQPNSVAVRMSLRDHGKDAKPKLPDLMP